MHLNSRLKYLATKIRLFVQSMTIFDVLILALPFSYRPILSFGRISDHNLEFSIAHIVAAFFVVTSLKKILNNRKLLWSYTAIRALLAYSLYSFLSISWAPSKFRGLVIAFFTLFVSLFFTAVMVKTKRSNLKRYIPTVYIAVTISCLFAWWQLFADAIGLGTSYSLLREQYRSTVFGFARPTAFMLEPLFLASLLLAPLLYCVFLELTKKNTKKSRMVLFVSSVTLVMTISRGGIIALGLGLAVFLFIRYSLSKWAKLLGVLLISCVVGLTTLTFMSGINDRDSISGPSALKRSLNHLSMGLLDLKVDDEKAINTNQNVAPISANNKLNDTPIGYVEESSNARIVMAKQAKNLMLKSKKNFVFGVGVSNFGPVLNSYDPEFPIGSVVNNQFLEVAVELGVIGLAIFLLFIAELVFRAFKARHWLSVSIILAYVTQWLFFSGNPNILHVWMVLAIVYMFSQKPHKKRT